MEVQGKAAYTRRVFKRNQNEFRVKKNTNEISSEKALFCKPELSWLFYFIFLTLFLNVMFLAVYQATNLKNLSKVKSLINALLK